jgi:hypothetical protein
VWHYSQTSSRICLIFGTVTQLTEDTPFKRRDASLTLAGPTILALYRTGLLTLLTVME